MTKKIIALIVILGGILLLLVNLGIVEDISFVNLLWPIVFIIIGCTGLIERKRFDAFYIIVALFGVIYLGIGLKILESIDISLVFWPIVIIVIGLSLLFNHHEGPKRISNQKTYTAVFGGIEEKNNDKKFTQTDISAIFGGVELDFSEIIIEGDKAYINVSAIFGGVELILPTKYKIKVNGTPILGGCENRTSSKAIDSDKELIINYVAICGGLEIKN